MKRIMIPLLCVGFMAAAVGIGGYLVVKYVSDWMPTGGLLRTTPFTIEELEKKLESGEVPEDDIPRLVECLSARDNSVREMAAALLGASGKPAVEPVRAKLNDTNATVRFYAVQALAHIGPEAAAASGDLAARLEDDDAAVRRKAVYALGAVGVKSEVVIKGLIKALSDADADVQADAAIAVEKLGPLPEALPEFAELAVNGATPELRTLGLKLLAQLGDPAMPTFRDMLKKSAPLEAIAIIRIVAPLGAQAKPLLPDLQNYMTKNRFGDADEELIGIFKKCGPDGAQGLTAVLRTLHNPKSEHFAPDYDRSKALLKAIGEMGSDAKSAVPLLIELLQDKAELRLEILDALGGIGPAAKDAIPFVQSLARTVPQARAALKRMGVVEKKVRPE